MKKNLTSLVRHALGKTTLILTMGGVFSISAAVVTYTNNDALNTSSFTSGCGVTNWDSGQAPSAGNDYLVASGRTLRSPTNGMAAGAYVFAGNSLTLGAGSAGSGILSLKCTNAVTVANLILTNGTILNGSGGGTPDVVKISGNILVATNGFFSPSVTNRYIRVSATISGSGGLSAISSGTVTLSGAHSYNGPITLTGTTLEWDTNSVMTPSALIVGKDATLVSITNVGQGTFTTNALPSTNIVRLGGNLNVGYGTGGDLRVGYRTSNNTNNNVVAVFDVSSQAQFNANVGNFIVGYSSVSSSSTRASAAGLVYLATNNNIIATNITIADTTEGVSTLTSLVYLGRGSNYIDTPTMIVGARKQLATLTLPAGGTLVLTNSIGGRTDLTIGGNASTTSGNPTDLMDLTGGPFKASLGNLVIGQKSGGLSGGATATLTLATNSANNVDVNAVTLGSMTGNVSGTTAAAGTLNLNGGSCKVNNDLTLASYDFSGSGTATGTLNLNAGIFMVAGNIANGGGTSTINLNNGSLSVAGDITSTGTSTINVNGGMLDLQPAGDATPGNLTASTLLLNGTLTNANNITVTSLSGSGASVNQSGVLTINGLLNPGTSSTAGTLTVGSLTLDSATTWRVNLAGTAIVGGGVNDLLVVNGDLSFPNASLIIAQTSSTLDATTPYVLATYTGALTGLPTYPANLGRYSLSLVADESTTPKQLKLVVTGNPYSLLWGGEFGSAWDVNATQNWTNRTDNSPQFFFDSDAVLFNDASPNPYVTVDVPVQPGSVTVSNDFNAYTITTSTGNGINGGGGLTKYGSSSLTLATSNTFTGPVNINAGLVIAGNGAALGATNGGTTIAANATLDVNNQNLGSELIHVQGVGYDGNGAIINSDSSNPQGARNAARYVVLDGPTTFGTPYRWDIRGTGAASSAFLQGGSYPLTKIGGSTLALTGGCDVNAGDLLVTQGNLAFETASTMNLGYGIAVSSGATLSFYQLATPLGRNVTLEDGATLSGNSSTAPNQNKLNGSLTLNGVGNINASTGASNILAGLVTGPGSLVKIGTGIAILTSTSNNWSGGTTINAGILQVGSGGADGSLSDVPLINNATLVYNSSNSMTLTAPITGPGTWQMQGAGLLTLNGPITGTGALNIRSNGNLTINGSIDTTAGVSKVGDGIVTLTASNSLPGNYTTGSGTPTSGGITRLLNSYGFGDPSISKTVSVIRAEVRLEGGINLGTNIYLFTSANAAIAGAGNGYVALRNVAGTNTVNSVIEVGGGAGDSEYSSDAGSLVFNGQIFLGNTSSRSAIFGGAGTGVVNGVITNTLEQGGTNALSVSKTGAGKWTLTAVNSYNGSTTVKGGTLLVNGSIGGTAVTVQTNSTLGGIGSINTATNTFLSGSHAVFTLGAPLKFSGALIVTNGGVIPDVHLNLSNNVPVGTYSLATYNITDSTGSFATAPVVDGGSFAAGNQGAITTSGGNVTLTVSVIPPSTPPNFSPGGVSVLPGGGISLVATGAINGTYKLWASTNLALTPFTNYATLLQSGTITTSPFTNIDLTATNYPQRFYLFSTP